MSESKSFGRPAKALLLIGDAIPIGFVVAMLLRAEHDESVAPNFAVLGVLGMVLSLAMAIAGRVRTKRIQKAWLLVLFANAMVVFTAAGVIDFSGFAGGGH
ncbi:MAG: hypothetical protein ACI89X_004256 [Planctomycetota bacterium]